MPSACHTLTFVNQLRELSERISGTGAVDKSGSWISRTVAKPSLDGLGSWFEGRITKFVAGEGGEDPSSTPAAPVPDASQQVGPFSHYAPVVSTPTWGQPPASQGSDELSAPADGGYSQYAPAAPAWGQPANQVEEPGTITDGYSSYAPPPPVSAPSWGQPIGQTDAQAADGNGYTPYSADSAPAWGAPATQDGGPAWGAPTAQADAPAWGAPAGQDDAPAWGAPAAQDSSAPSASTAQAVYADDDDDDLGLGNSKPRPKGPPPASAAAATSAASEKPKAAEPEAKRASSSLHLRRPVAVRPLADALPSFRILPVPQPRRRLPRRAGRGSASSGAARRSRRRRRRPVRPVRRSRPSSARNRPSTSTRTSRSGSTRRCVPRALSSRARLFCAGLTPEPSRAPLLAPGRRSRGRRPGRAAAAAVAGPDVVSLARDAPVALCQRRELARADASPGARGAVRPRQRQPVVVVVVWPSSAPFAHRVRPWPAARSSSSVLQRPLVGPRISLADAPSSCPAGFDRRPAPSPLSRRTARRRPQAKVARPARGAPRERPALARADADRQRGCAQEEPALALRASLFLLAVFTPPSGKLVTEH